VSLEREHQDFYEDLFPFLREKKDFCDWTILEDHTFLTALALTSEWNTCLHGYDCRLSFALFSTGTTARICARIWEKDPRSNKRLLEKRLSIKPNGATWQMVWNCFFAEVTPEMVEAVFREREEGFQEWCISNGVEN
jgi:hypothetical protein